jgi:alpha-L-fucosidase
MDRLAWWTDARFGLMIHWGVYAALGGYWRGERVEGLGEWIRWHGKIPAEEYAKVAADFDPKDFDADAWARLAAAAGMRHLVFTAKHHDGFALFDSAVDRFNSVRHARFGRDAVAELAAACRRHGVKFGLYYSHAIDWNEPDAAQHWSDPGAEGRDFEAYFRRKSLPQLRELLTNYGEVSVLWLDMPFLINAAQCDEILSLVRELQPGCLVNSRLGWTSTWDFSSMGDNEIPATAPHHAWETAATINDTWGYRSDDEAWKSPADVLRLLTTIAGKGGNLLMNVGPDGDGRIPEPAAECLREVGRWLGAHGSAVYGTSAGPLPYDLPQGPMTQRGRTLYLFLDGWEGAVQVAGLPQPSKVVEVRDPILSMLTMEFEEAPTVDPVPQPQGDGEILLPAALADLEGEMRLDGSGGGFGGPGRLGWTLRSAGGRYEVWLDSICPDHRENGGRWQGGGRVALDGNEVRLSADRPLDTARSRYYEEVASRIGEVDLTTGEAKLALDILEPLGPRVTALRLVPLAESAANA